MPALASVNANFLFTMHNCGRRYLWWRQRSPAARHDMKTTVTSHGSYSTTLINRRRWHSHTQRTHSPGFKLLATQFSWRTMYMALITYRVRGGLVARTTCAFCGNNAPAFLEDRRRAVADYGASGASGLDGVTDRRARDKVIERRRASEHIPPRFLVEDYCFRHACARNNTGDADVVGTGRRRDGSMRLWCVQ